MGVEGAQHLPESGPLLVQPNQKLKLLRETLNTPLFSVTPSGHKLFGTGTHSISFSTVAIVGLADNYQKIIHKSWFIGQNGVKSKNQTNSIKGEK